MPAESDQRSKRPAVLLVQQADVTLQGLRIRRGTHLMVQDEDLLIPWTQMRVYNQTGGAGAEIIDEEGTFVAKWLVPSEQKRTVRRAIWHAHRQAIGRGGGGAVRAHG